MTLKSEIQSMIHDWYKYLNTTVPRGADGGIFTHVLYTNRDKMQTLRDKFPEIDSRVIEQEAIRQYLNKSEEEILKDMKEYYGKVVSKIE